MNRSEFAATVAEALTFSHGSREFRANVWAKHGRVRVYVKTRSVAVSYPPFKDDGYVEITRDEDGDIVADWSHVGWDSVIGERLQNTVLA